MKINKFILTLTSCATIFSSVMAEDNLLENGDFEIFDNAAKPLGWEINIDDSTRTSKVVIDNEEKYEGEGALKIHIENQEAFCSAKQIIEVKSNQNYELTGVAKIADIDGDGAGARLYVTDKDSAAELGYSDIKTYDWQPASVTFNSGEHTTIVIRCYLHKTAGTAWFDNVVLKEVP